MSKTNRAGELIHAIGIIKEVLDSVLWGYPGRPRQILRLSYLLDTLGLT